MTNPMALSPRKNWWGRNWKWVVPLGIVVPALACAGLVTLIVTLVFGMIKSSDPYRTSLAAAQSSPQVQAALGTPIYPGWLVTGQINTSGSAGDANLSYGISGPKGAATVRVNGEKRAGIWTYSQLDATLQADGRTIDLLGTR